MNILSRVKESFNSKRIFLMARLNWNSSIKSLVQEQSKLRSFWPKSSRKTTRSASISTRYLKTLGWHATDVRRSTWIWRSPLSWSPLSSSMRSATCHKGPNSFRTYPQTTGKTRTLAPSTTRQRTVSMMLWSNQCRWEVSQPAANVALRRKKVAR